MERIEYIDKLKGFAIIFMVMGHIMQISFGIGNTAFNHFYTSFHMPIFMFLSGIFVYKGFKDWNSKEVWEFIINKIKRILFPFFVIGGLYCLIFCHSVMVLLNGAFSGYWFLPALFICMICDLFVSYIVKKMSIDNILINILVRLLVWLFIICICYYVLDYLYFRSVVFHYPFFCMGVFFGKYEKFKQLVFTNNNFYTFMLVMYFILWFLPSSVRFNIIAFTSIPILVYLFNKYNRYIPNVFNILGVCSLEIYVLHRFFVPSLYHIGQYFYHFMPFDKSENFIVYFIISLIVSIPICFVCVLLSKIISASDFLRKLCFGYK